MRRLSLLIALATAASYAQQPFTLQQVLSAPYATNLTAAPVGSLFAWVEDAEGRHNLWVGGASSPARQLTHNTEDDAQDIGGLAWSPDGSTIAYVYGAATGNSGRPANPAHLQRSTAVEIILQPISGSNAIHVGEGRAPLFTPDGKSLLFLRSGQIFVADIANLEFCTANKNCHPEPIEKPVLSDPSQNLSSRPERSVVERPVSSSAEARTPIHSLLYDRGTASQLALSPDGTKLAYISHRRTHSYLALYNLTTKELTFPAPSTGNDSAPVFSRDGKYLAWLRFPFTDASEFAGNRTSPNPWSIQLDDLTTNSTRTLFQPEPNQPGSAEPRLATGEPHLLWAADDRILFFSETDRFVHLYSVSASHPSVATLLTPGDYEVEDPTISVDGKTVLYSANAPASSPGDINTAGNVIATPGNVDRRNLWKLDLDGRQPHPVALTMCCSIDTHPQLTPSGSIAALIADAQWPMHPELIPAEPQLGDNRLRLPLNHGVAGPTLLVPQQVLFPSSDKLFQLHGQLFMPKVPSTGKRPAILFFHGGPKRQMLLGYPSMDYYSNAYAMNQYLASRGYIVLSVNYRGGIGYGLDFRQCQHCGADGAAEYADALGAVAYLRSRPDVDTAHIGIWGGSYGGYFVGLALARNSDLFAAGVDFHGVHEWAREDNAAADWLRGSLAEQEKIAAIAHASSPMADVDKWKSPVLLIHGDDDPDVAYTQTPMLADALRARGVHVEELIFPDELHGFVLHRDWLAAYTAAADFFDRTLKPGTNPVKKPEQNPVK